MDTLLLNLAYISYITASLMPSGLKLCLGLIAQSIAFVTLVEGEVMVTTASGLHRVRTAACFTGEMRLLSGDAASADVIAATAIGFRRWTGRPAGAATKPASGPE